jgi:hypothetical protein
MTHSISRSAQFFYEGPRPRLDGCRARTLTEAGCDDLGRACFPRDVDFGGGVELGTVTVPHPYRIVTGGKAAGVVAEIKAAVTVTRFTGLAFEEVHDACGHGEVDRELEAAVPLGVPVTDGNRIGVRGRLDFIDWA